MNQFKTVFKFEYMGYIKNRAFQVMTIIITAAIILASFIPKVSDIVSGLGGGGAKIGQTAGFALGENTEGMVLTAQMLSEAAPDYTWEQVDSSADFNALIVDETYAAVFFYNGGDTYDFYSTGRNLNEYGAMNGLSEIVGKLHASELIRGLGPDAQTAIDLISAMEVKQNHISVSGNFEQNYFLAYALVFVLYFALIFHNQFIITSVITEKTSKAMELLITSAKPWSLMFGKVLGVGAAAITQLIWFFVVVVAMLFVNLDSLAQSVPDLTQVATTTVTSPFILFSFVVFFLLGYFIYAFFYAALGSTVSRMEDASSVTIYPTLFIMAGFFASVFGSMNSVDSVLIKVLSYIPLFSPMVMFTRQCMNSAAVWEVLISMVLSLGGVILMGLAGAKIYRTGVNMYGKAATPKELIRMLTRR
ncbi:MAG: ABC transporter permease [Clostridiales bacterium]|jgi:ABC-2 type transport system permease protein|nr:ABC transporter permease [Clostridiales bacterium]